MDFQRILANAIARRIAYVLVAIALAWLGIGNARAQSAGCAPGAGCDQGEAYIAAVEWANIRGPAVCQMIGGSSSTYLGPNVVQSGPDSYSAQVSCSIGGSSASAGSTYFVIGDSCAARPDYIGRPPMSTNYAVPPVQGATSCMSGCTTYWYNNGDGTWSGVPGGSVCTDQQHKDECELTGDAVWNAYIGMCQPKEQKCSANQVKNAATGECDDTCPVGLKMDGTGVCVQAEDDCPAGNVKAPSGECLPGDGQCAVGEARRPNGTCGKDSDGDGEADEDDDDPENDPDKETASGGDSCDSPPSCSGGAIACMQVKIQWRIDCNTRKAANVTGGTCGAIPVCTGKSCDALEDSQLLQQWKAACALEKIAAGASGGGDGDGVVELLTGPGSINSNAGGGDSLEDGSPWGEEGDEYEPDASGYGYSRACPSPPSFTLPGGQSVSIDLTPLCNWVSLGGSMVLLLSGLLSLRIVAGGNA